MFYKILKKVILFNMMIKVAWGVALPTTLYSHILILNLPKLSALYLNNDMKSIREICKVLGLAVVLMLDTHLPQWIFLWPVLQQSGRIRI